MARPPDPILEDVATTYAHVLVVEDDAGVRDLLRRGLSENGFRVTTVTDGAAALRAAGDDVDAVVLDIGLPDADGRDVCQAMRAQGLHMPVLFLTARDGVTDRLSGFSAGGDDYLGKPFALSELVARLQVGLRRAGVSGQVTVAELTLDPVTHRLTHGDASTPLTPTEFALLATLMAAPGAVIRRAQLRRAGWPDGAIVSDNTLDQYLARVRRRLRSVDAERSIDTVRGVGYRLL